MPPHTYNTKKTDVHYTHETSYMHAMPTFSLSPSAIQQRPLTQCAACRFDCTGKRIAYLDANVLSEDVLYATTPFLQCIIVTL
jgi:hypothetical protein